MPIGVPSPKPQPNKPSYGLNELELFTHYTRDSYRTATGSAAPPCDPTKKLKCWLDSTVDLDDPEGLVAYDTPKTGADGKTTMKKFSMTAQEAASVNLPGREAYPPYVVAPTSAFVRVDTGSGTVEQGVDPSWLLLKSEAVALAAELGSAVPPQENAMAGTVYPASELRRQFLIWVCGSWKQAGLLMKERSKGGVGAPGHWDLSESDPTFIVELPPDTSPKGEWPAPLRDLLPNEAFDPHPFMPGVVQIIRTDLQQAANEQGGGFLPEDRATIQRIEAKLGELLAAGKGGGS